MGERTYRTIRWGKGLQIWMVEGRLYRSPNTMEDGLQKTIWGKEQLASDMERLHGEHFRKFRQLMRDHDPEGKFANGFTRRLFGK